MIKKLFFFNYCKTSLLLLQKSRLICLVGLFTNFFDETSFESLLHIGLIIFIFSVLGLVLNKSSVILYMVGLEMAMLGCSFNFIIFSIYNNSLEGLNIALVILAIAASETSVGLGIVVACYSRNYSLNMLDFERSGGF